MNVKELKDLLVDQPDNRTVLLSRDEEGNGFNEAEGWSVHHYQPSGYSYELLEEDDKAFPQAFVLWP